jgi:hypothetical protein
MLSLWLVAPSCTAKISVFLPRCSLAFERGLCLACVTIVSQVLVDLNFYAMCSPTISLCNWLCEPADVACCLFRCYHFCSNFFQELSRPLDYLLRDVVARFPLVGGKRSDSSTSSCTPLLPRLGNAAAASAVPASYVPQSLERLLIPSFNS